jgi:hypothetical protein
MTTPENDLSAGDIDSVANSLFMDEDDQKNLRDDAAEADAETQADDDASDEDGSSDDDSGEDADDTDETDGETDGDEAPQSKHRVKVDGQEQEVTLDDLKRAFAGQGYIQRRMQETAEIRKETEANYHAVNEQAAHYAQGLAIIQQQLAAYQSAKPPSRELLKTDPIRYLEEDALHREHMEQSQILAQQQAFVSHQQSEQQAHAYGIYLSEQAELLTRAIPDFSDAKKAGALKAKLIETGNQVYGFSPDELNQVSDARHVAVLHDAMRYRQLMAGKDRVAEKVGQVNRPMVRPGTKRTENDSSKTSEQTNRARMKSTGSVDDVAKFLLG